MTAPTHIFGGVAVLLTVCVMFRSLDVTWFNMGFTVLASLIPDIDNPKAVIGTLFRRLVLVLSFGNIDVARCVQHRGFFHSLSFLALLSVLFYFLNPALIPCLVLGFLSHIFLDGFNRCGLKIFGFGPYWGRFSLNWHIPMRSPGEYSILASSLLVIALCSAIISRGGMNRIIQKALGNYRSSEEAIHSLPDYRLSLVVSDGITEESYEVVDVTGNSIILSKGGVLLKYGHDSTCQIQAAGKKAYVVKGDKIRKFSYQFLMKDKPLKYLYHKIDGSYSYYFSGNAVLEEPAEIPRFFNRYNTVSSNGRSVSFSFAHLEDLFIYNIENKKIRFGDFKIVYRVAEGQHVPSLKAKIENEISASTQEVEQRIEELKGIISDRDIFARVEKIFGVSSEETGIYVRILKEKAEDLLRAEEVELLRIRSTRKDY